MKYYNIHGQRFTVSCSGEQAFIYQHECDHLEGVDFLKKADKIIDFQDTP